MWWNTHISRVVEHPHISWTVLEKSGKKIDQWTAKQNRYEGLGLSTDRPQEASGRLRRPQTVPNWSGTKNRLMWVFHHTTKAPD